MYTNTTDIPDQLVGIMTRLIMEELRCSTPKIIRIRNKRERRDKRASVGRWGWYHIQLQRVTVYIPEELPPTGVTFSRKYSRKIVHFRSRADHLMLVLAHEMRHHWQYMSWDNDKDRWRLGHNELGRIAKETDCELFEYESLVRWQLMTGMTEEEIKKKTTPPQKVIHPQVAEAMERLGLRR